jgi:hypothetical protein
MKSRRLGFALAAATAAVLGLASVAWACVPGHDHMSPEEEAEHNALGYHPGAAAPAPAPAPAPAAAVPTATAAATQTQSPTVAPTQTPAPAPVAAAAPTRTAATVAPRPAAPVAPAASAPAVAAPTAAPAAVATPQPAAAPASPLVTSAPEVIPSMPDVAPVDAFADTESQPAASDGGSAREVLGYAVLGLGIVLLVGALLSGMGRWRSGAGPRPLAD